MTPFEEGVIRWILIALGVYLFSGIVYKFFFKQQEPIIIRPVPSKVEVKRTR